jgi:diphthamide synthase (EF-2-diphthine--ammonia ligase)
MKIAINKSHGGFVLSDKAMRRYAELSNIHFVFEDGEFYTGFVDPDNLFCDSDIARNDINLIKTIEELGGDASYKYSDIIIKEIPDNVDWVIINDKGQETIQINAR